RSVAAMLPFVVFLVVSPVSRARASSSSSGVVGSRGGNGGCDGRVCALAFCPKIVTKTGKIQKPRRSIHAKSRGRTENLAESQAALVHKNYTSKITKELNTEGTQEHEEK